MTVPYVAPTHTALTVVPHPTAHPEDPMPENQACAQCGMLVEPAMAFHPFLYCQLFQLGVLDPARFLEGQHFIPDPAHWGEGAPARQREASR